MTQNTLNIHNLSITASLAKIEGSVIAEKALHKMAVCNSSFFNFDITDDALSFAWIVVMSELTPLQKELVESISTLSQGYGGGFESVCDSTFNHYYSCDGILNCNECQSHTGNPCSTHG